MTPSEDALSAILKRENWVVAAALFVLTLLAWAYVVWLAAGMSAPAAAPMGDMPGMPGMESISPSIAPWTASHFLFLFAMWAVMMVGMMTPSAAPMILIYSQVARQAGTLGRPFAPAGWFALGYLSCWLLFALAASGAQYGLEHASLLTPMMAVASRYFGGAVLIVAGAYQWTPLKESCLAQCRAPLSFVQRHGGFQSGIAGSLRLGALHGLYCIGCCWALMAILFVAGIMSLVWIAMLMIFVLAEKVVPGGRILTRLAGLAAIGAGVWVLVK
ncbi:MAG TPA: DUF2182 domain-containing protein [Rhizomicrobium sp.]